MDEERTGGIIHSAMFARLLAELVVADFTFVNAKNVERIALTPHGSVEKVLVLFVVMYK